MELPAPDFERLGPPAKSTILVIGGCGGIGYAFASAAAQLGCNVIVMDLPAGDCQRKVSLNRPALGSTYEQKPIPLFQNLVRNHPTRGHDVCAISTFTAQCGRPPARTRNRYLPRKCAALGRSIWSDLRW